MAASTTSLKLPDDVKQRVQQVATAQRRSAHWVMREAIAQYLDREERQAAYRQEALASWKDYQATGRHVTADEADQWLARLEAGEDADPPECHG
jgi:predicted transcriptional regulator